MDLFVRISVPQLEVQRVGSDLNLVAALIRRLLSEKICKAAAHRLVMILSGKLSTRVGSDPFHLSIKAPRPGQDQIQDDEAKQD
ncbi:hypothetical protein GGD54_006339 [Rhizobium tropici]|uniref:Uncharacterized protein n=2 Tax=Rhizobium TaxID=379 RepID=A0A1C3X8L1_9HYPH|nr:hypothetical protein [Rhizobium tropici]MBB5596841.1 hypothetical protein [Rhizobium tropici]MBB6489577.1 hypothetical protein [Rhizobium lusitanum]MBB6495890.1 hypothetical protein [Rhizobium tropici]SCB48555.1 hypothetical protein GA0061101_12829 [Rhizobium lusitanum]